MKRNKLNFEEISQSMEVLDRDSQRGIKGGLTAAEMLADIAANGIAKYAGKTFSFEGGQYGYISNNVSIDSGSSGFTSGFAAYGGQGGYGNPYHLAEVVVTAKPLNSRSSSGGNYMAGALAISTGLLADDFTGVGFLDDLAIPFILLGAWLFDKFNSGNGNENYPGPWNYTFEHHTQNPIHNAPNGFDPNNIQPNLGNADKWLIRGAFSYQMYEEYKERMKQIGAESGASSRDSTEVVQPQYIPYHYK